ncbi:uncharacterized protein BROUX77_005872 [Berkeleyomyces rouxiae]|uniref:uncharacterized protein n=1 Tax=Berkeleyomyces rouxiae TaxID=2035830 RepID=UPI003B769196
MIQKPSTPQTRGKPVATPSGRRRGRPPGSTNAVRAARLAAAAAAAAGGVDTDAFDAGSPMSSGLPRRRRYVPSGPGGNGRFIDDNGLTTTTPVPETERITRATAAPGATHQRDRHDHNHGDDSPSSISVARRVAQNPRRRREDIEDSEEYGSAAAMAAAVAQSEGYKPREERGWEEFHPDLDIEACFKIFSATEVDGTALADGMEAKDVVLLPPTTPPKRRVGRPPRDSSAYGGISRTPAVLPIHNQTPKEKLDLKRPSYRRTNRVSLFESKALGTARYVDQPMANVGFQETDRFYQPEDTLIKASDGGWDDDHHDHLLAATARTGTDKSLSRVEYDMDEQDDMWLEAINRERKANDFPPITRELFEITITRIEKEWHALEKRIPKPNPKPPQTQRPRSSSAAAVNGEAQAGPSSGEEPDSKCAICDDGDCENTNAIVFCDGCDLAVHQECYGVPFIPEGQWLCRKCQIIGRGIPTCIFCPNTDGAFKQTNASKWAHLLCAMWIPEVSLGNHTFMEPVMEVEKVPKTRWRLSCYICKQRMGACIQCSNKSCFQAFHVTCARRARLFLKMKTSQGVLAVLDGGMTLKAFCDRHCPPDYAENNKVIETTRAARRFYRKKMKGRLWADSHATAALMAAQHSVACVSSAEGSPAPSSGGSGTVTPGGTVTEKKKGIVWKLPSGAPVIPASVFDAVDSAMGRFAIRRRRDFVANVCRYWTLKREARRGAALLKRLQLQMETFSSMELTRRNFVAMGPSGKGRLQRRIDFADSLLRDLAALQGLSEALVAREALKLEAAELELDFVDTCYFPVARDIAPAIEKAQALDKNVFAMGFLGLQARLDQRYYTTTLAFARDFADIINKGIVSGENTMARPRPLGLEASPTKQNFGDIRPRKTLGKNIIRAVKPYLEAALATEATALCKPVEEMHRELETILQAATETPSPTPAGRPPVPATSEDAVMDDAPLLARSVAEDTTTGDVSKPKVLQVTDPEEHVADKLLSQATPPQTTEPSLPPPSASAPHGSPDNKPPALAETVVALNQPPPTPPQSTSNMSFLSTVSAPVPSNVLNNGGLLWYLASFDVKGLSAIDHPVNEVECAISEELADVDDHTPRGPGQVGRKADATFSGGDIQQASDKQLAVAQEGEPQTEAWKNPAEQDVEMTDALESVETDAPTMAALHRKSQMNSSEEPVHSTVQATTPPPIAEFNYAATPEPTTSQPSTGGATSAEPPPVTTPAAPHIVVTNASSAASPACEPVSDNATIAPPAVTSPRRSTPRKVVGSPLKATSSPKPTAASLANPAPEPEPELEQQALPLPKLLPIESALPHHPAPQSALSELSEVSSLPSMDADSDVDAEGEPDDDPEPAVQTRDAIAAALVPADGAQPAHTVMVERPASKDSRAALSPQLPHTPPVTRATRANVAAAREAQEAKEAREAQEAEALLQLERKKRTRSSTRTRR